MTVDADTPIRQFRYRLTREDVAAFELLPRELFGLEKLWLFGPILVCGALVGLFQDELKPYFPWDPETQLGQVLSVLSAVATGYALSLVALTARARYRINKAKVPSTETVVDAYQQLLLSGEKGDQSSYAWTKLAVVETATHVFLTQAGRAPVILPLRAFRDASDMANFAAAARAFGRDQGGEDQDAETDGATAAKDDRR